MIKYIVGRDETKDCFRIVALEEKCKHCNENISKKKRYLELNIEDEYLANEVCRVLNEECEKNIAEKVIENFSFNS